MSRVQERDSSLFNDIANTTIAGQLESRLKELERNIAVARQFIKLADECYTQVKHEWELLQQDARSSKPDAEAHRHETSFENHEDNILKGALKGKEPRSASDAKEDDSESTLTHTPSLGSKSHTSKTRGAPSPKINKQLGSSPPKSARNLKSTRKENNPTKE